MAKQGKLTAEAVPAEGGIMSGYHAQVYSAGKGGKGKNILYRSPHAFTSEADAIANARQWAEANAEENE